MHRDYSATPLPQKLGIEPRLRGEFDVAVLFATRRGELTRSFAPLARRLAPSGGLWVAWPKKASERETDLSFDEVQRIGLEVGLVDNKSAAVDDEWQAVRFVYRLRDRP